jgi:hypothetical protein
MTNISGAQENYEFTEVDIFSLGKLPYGTEVSVRGVSIGDSMESVLKRFNKEQKHIKTVKAGGFNLEAEKDMVILFSDKKVVSEIVLHGDFNNGNFKGKAAEFFNLPSEGRMKVFVETLFGKPDYVHRITGVLSWHHMFYLKGFQFTMLMSWPKIGICSKEKIIDTIEYYGAKKVGEAEKDIPKPNISSSAGFRNTLWGMSKEQVKKAEASEFIKEDKVGGEVKGLDIIVYVTEVAGLDCTIGYYFADNMLTRARYLITEEHTNKNLYIGDFEKIKGKLNQKYSSPKRDDAIWSNELYKDDHSEYGTAVGIGHLMYVAEWYPPETTIQMLLRGDNYKITLWVEYTGDDFREFEEKVRKKAQEDVW